MAKLDMRLLAECLRALRDAHGLSQTALATRAGLNLGNVNELEQQRKASVRADTIVALASTLGVSSDYLLGLTDDPQPRPKGRRKRPAPAEAGEEEADLERVFTRLRPTYQEVLGLMAIGQTTDHPPATLKALAQHGLLEVIEEPCRDTLGASPFRRYDMPLHVHIAWCAWAAAQPEKADDEELTYV